MSRRLVALALCFAACARGSDTGSIESAAALSDSKENTGNCVTFVVFRSAASRARRAPLHERAGAARIERLPFAPEIELVRPHRCEDVKRLRAAYASMPEVTRVVADVEATLADATNDARYAEQWGLENTGQSGGLVDADVNGPEGWAVTRGRPDVVVGIIDTGLDLAHPDLAGAAWTNPLEIPGNSIDDDGDGYIDDVHGIDPDVIDAEVTDPIGHGSHVAGIIAARAGDAFGIAGVAPLVSVLPCKFTTGATRNGPLSKVVQCLAWFHRLRTRPQSPVDVRVVNLSLTAPAEVPGLREGIEALGALGTLHVAAAGNSGLDIDRVPFFPASYGPPFVVAVGATDRSDIPAAFNFGHRSVLLYAPGVAILSDMRGGGFVALAGTSQAAPHVAGIAALAASQDLARTPANVRGLLASGAIPVGILDAYGLTAARVRAADSGGRGALTCASHPFVRRERPAAEVLSLARGTPSIDVVVTHADCGRPLPIPALRDRTGNTLTLHDDGRAPDLAANDGVSGLTVPLPDSSGFSLDFDDDRDDLPVLLVDGLAPAVVVPNGIRTLDASARTFPLARERTTTLDLPFPVRIAGADGVTRWTVSENGWMSPTERLGLPSASPDLPTRTAQLVVAPFWDDLDPGADSILKVGVLGTAPDREAVVEWRNLQRNPASTATAAKTVSFQVVFRESDGAILFGYPDATFDPADAANAGNSGRSATIGVQLTADDARVFSTRTPSLSDGLTLRFDTNARPVAFPTFAPGPVGRGAPVTLLATVSDRDGDDGPYTFEWDFDCGTDGFSANDTSTQQHVTGQASAGAIAGDVGPWAFAVRAIDGRGAASAWKRIETTVVDGGPVLRDLVLPTDPVLTGEEFTVSVTLDDASPGAGPWRIEWMSAFEGAPFVAERVFGVAEKGVVEATFRARGGGPKRFAVRAIDDDGLSSPLLTGDYAVQSVSPDVSELAADPLEGAEPLSVSFSATATPGAANEPITAYAWDFDADGTFEETSAGPSITHVFEDGDDRARTVTLRVSDADSFTDRTISVRVTNLPPIVESPGNWGLLVNNADTLHVDAHDPSPRDVLTYALVSPPAGLTIDASGTLSWNPTSDQCAPVPGLEHPITVRVFDDEGASADTSFKATCIGPRVIDAGTPEPDAGTPDEDAGTTFVDAGHDGADAGPTPPAPAPCGCGGALGWPMLLAPLLRRRRGA